MIERAHLAILNREESLAHVHQHLSESVAFLTDVVNYGTNLIIRCLGDEAEDVVKFVVCGGLLKHVVSMLDAAVVLLENGHCSGGMLPARSAFEASLYAELILKKDAQRRARLYLVGEYRRRRDFALSILDNSNAPGSFNAKFAPIDFNTDSIDPEAKDFARQEIQRINKHLKMPPLDTIDAQFQRARAKKNYDPRWHQCVGFNSLREIAKDLEQIPSYELFYGAGSKIMHAESIATQVAVKDGMAGLKPIRNLEHADTLCAALSQTAVRTYRVVLSHYRPLELSAFADKYRRDWQTPFHLTSRVTYRC